jgi:cytosine permease
MQKTSAALSGNELVERVDALYEFEREPVTSDKLQPGWYFAGLFAGEHVAGTEFVIGALFVSWGATTRDILLGLLLGNFLAVLSWTLVCAPIAVETRLTLYWYLRRIAGPGVTAMYNVLNALLYCVLAGSMITVSASAVRIPFGIPPQTGWYPDDWRFVGIVVTVGAIVVLLAILGFESLARFSAVCSPWIFAMFFAGAVMMLPQLGEIHSVADFLRVANEKIWAGPAPGQARTIGFWHVVAFAWICNLAMHIGLSDMALLRYAKRSSYGLYSACGMYLGHYLAWITAGIMGAGTAHLLKMPLTQLDAGEVAYQSLGVAGAIAVVLAGWTTSNPTLYRAGLALQTVTPGWPRWFVTLLAGVATVLMACSPFVFQYLLQFVAVYGILLMPVGAIVIAEHWIFPRIGLAPFAAQRMGKMFHWPVLLTWMAAIGAAFGLAYTGTLHEFFLAVPIWVLSVVLYIALSIVAGTGGQVARVSPDNTAPSARPDARSAITPAAGQRVVKSSQRIVSGILGLLTAGTFVACLALPVWAFEQQQATGRAPEGIYRWLAIVSVTHLTLAALWGGLRAKITEATA